MRQLITEFPLPIYSTISTLLFVMLFLGIIYWAWRMQSKESMDARARLPFNDEDQSEDSQAGVKE